MARKVYESRLFAGAGEGLAYDTEHAACEASALSLLGGQNLFDLPDEVCWLIEGMLDQVQMLLCRRQDMWS